MKESSPSSIPPSPPIGPSDDPLSEIDLKILEILEELQYYQLF